MSEMNKWINAGVLSYFILTILSPIIVIGKEFSAGFKGFFVGFGAALGIEHHLYGHIMFLIILFIIMVLLFAYTSIGDKFASLLKLEDYENASKLTFWSTIISTLVIMGLFTILLFTH